MTYTKWFTEHSQKHKSILKTLSNKSKNEIIDYFTYENMRANHIDFCLLYATNTKCHNMKNLNCYACGCPYFRFSDDGIDLLKGRIVYSKCIKSLGSQYVSENAIHHDCSSCEVPHKTKFVSDNFDIDWNEIMNEVSIESK
jgi:hypothetical protein